MAIQLVPNAVVADRFRLNHPIGRGGMGSVWHATHLGLDIPCAIKFIEGEYALVADAQARFEREAKAAATLRSPHVVQILDHGVCDGTPYIAMELLDGEDLGKRLQRVGALHPQEIHTVINQVCRALTKAHGLGIVHRDLKPDNIFIVRDDDREIAKVLDFGIAKRDQNAIQGGGTKTGAMLGTPYYMSPEQAQGTKSVDFRSDLWSLAVIVYQSLTGTLPFESEALGDLLMKIIVNPLPVPSRVGQVPLGFDGWWARAASRDPSARFSSAKEFADSLGLVFGVSQGSGVMERPGWGVVQGATPPAGPTPPPRERNAGGSALRASTGGTMARTFNDPDQGTAIPKRSPPVGLLLGGGALLVAAAIGAVVFLARGRGDAVAPAAAQSVAALMPPSASPQASAALAPLPVASVAAPPPSAQPMASSSAMEPSRDVVAPREAPTAHEASSHAHAAAKTPPKPVSPGAKPPPAAPAKTDLGF